MQTRTILTLVRHGETGANLEGVWHGSIDTPLTDAGHEQARRVAEHVVSAYPETTTVYTSPLQRAQHTAAAIARCLDVDLRTEAALSEFALGEWEGKPFAELYEVHRLWHRWRDDPDYAPPGAETVRQVAERMSLALRRIAARHPGERVVTVTHGGAMTLGLGFLLEGTFNTWSRVVANCSVSELVLDPEPRLLSFNRTDHLGDD